MFSPVSNIVLDLVLPRICAACDHKLLRTQYIICKDCSDKLELANSSLLTHEFNRKFLDEKLISDFTSLYVFRENSLLKNVIHKLKYEQRFQICKFLGMQVGENLKTKILEWEADLLIPIPLYKLRKFERGFNQANEIAKGVGKILDFPVDSKSLIRTRFTETQTHLNINERKDNIKDAFKVRNHNKIKNKNIILIDDVITTGATTSECAKVLLDNGAAKIYALSVAIAE